jgi:undecaprenyl-diphosphatase
MLHALLALNWQTFEDINQPAGHQRVFDPLMVFGAQDVLFLMPLIVLALWAGLAFVLPRAVDGNASGASFAQARALGLRFVLLAVPAVILAVAFNIVIGALVPEPRPFISHPSAVHQLIAHAADGSFPSDHEAVAAALATLLVVYVAVALRQRTIARARGATPGELTPVVRLAAILALLAVLGIAYIGLARIYVGVHYPGDILGGMLCGAIAAIVVVSIRPLLEPLLRPVIQMAERLRLA